MNATLPPSAMKAFIGLASNESGERMLPAAMAAIRGSRLGEIVAISRVYESTAAPPSMGQYLNAAVAVETSIEPAILKARLREIETVLGRDRSESTVAIDLDLILCGDLVDPELQLPSEDLSTFAHAIVPVAECDPDFTHPVLRERLEDMAARVSRSDVRRLSLREDVLLGSMEERGRDRSV